MAQIAPTETVLARDAIAGGETSSVPQPPAVLPGVRGAGESSVRRGTMAPSEGPSGATGGVAASFPDDADANGVGPANGKGRERRRVRTSQNPAVLSGALSVVLREAGMGRAGDGYPRG